MTETPHSNTTDLAHQIAHGLHERASQLPDAQTTRFASQYEDGTRTTVPLEGNKQLNIEKGSQRAFGGDVEYTRISVSGGDPQEQHPVIRVGETEKATKYVSPKFVSFGGRYNTESAVQAAKPSQVLKAIHKVIAAKEEANK